MKMYLDAAKVFNRKTCIEYGFWNFHLLNPSLATEISLLTTEEQNGLLTQSLKWDKDFNWFKKRVAVAILGTNA